MVSSLGSSIGCFCVVESSRSCDKISAVAFWYFWSESNFFLSFEYDVIAISRIACVTFFVDLIALMRLYRCMR